MYCATPSRKKKKEQKKQKKKKSKCGCRESFHRFAANSFYSFFFRFKALTLPAEVWRFAEPFEPAEAQPRSVRCARLPRRSRLQNGRQPSHTHTAYTFFASHSRVLSILYVSTRARMHVWRSQLTLFFLHRESESLPTVNAIHQCVMSRVVESDVYEWNLVFDHLLLFLFSLGPFSGVLSSTYILILPTFA